MFMMSYLNKKVVRNYFILLVCYTSVALVVFSYLREYYWVPKIQIIHVPEIREHTEDWDLFLEALMFVESKHNPLAIGTLNDAGVLQITPVYMTEANRILGHNRFTLSDRYNKKKSIEMFNIVNDFYNPERDLHLALKIHNPKAPLSYHLKVINKYKELVGYE